jgi:hypothetical protein
MRTRYYVWGILLAALMARGTSRGSGRDDAMAAATASRAANEGGAAQRETVRALVDQFRGREEAPARSAIDGLVSQGQAAIPGLIRLRGNRQPFAAAGWLGPAESSQMIIASPSGGMSEGAGVSVEVAALYVICAIYDGSRQSVHTPYLTDLTLASERRRSANTRRLVSRSWKSVTLWYAEVSRLGLAEVQRRGDGPLKTAQVSFW